MLKFDFLHCAKNTILCRYLFLTTKLEIDTAHLVQIHLIVQNLQNSLVYCTSDDLDMNYFQPRFQRQGLDFIYWVFLVNN